MSLPFVRVLPNFLYLANLNLVILWNMGKINDRLWFNDQIYHINDFFAIKTNRKVSFVKFRGYILKSFLFWQFCAPDWPFSQEWFVWLRFGFFLNMENSPLNLYNDWILKKQSISLTRKTWIRQATFVEYIFDFPIFGLCYVSLVWITIGYAIWVYILPFFDMIVFDYDYVWL